MDRMTMTLDGMSFLICFLVAWIILLKYDRR